MDTTSSAPSPPPRALIRAIWRGHRLLVRLSGARLGLPAPRRGKRMGMMRVHAIGRNSGEPRPVVLGYFDDGDALITLAMNGWAPADPSWLKNLRAHPEECVDLGRTRRTVRARMAADEEHDRLWARFTDYPGWGDVDAFAARRPDGTAIVVLDPA
jgi:deazaflavin-dependent oxidoreductase (nitroreductase family)